MMINPFLMAALITLNKEIFALAGIVVFIRYTCARKFRLWWLGLALVLSLFARWQQMAVILIYVLLESRISPVRGRPRWRCSLTVQIFKDAYYLV